MVTSKVVTTSLHTVVSSAPCAADLSLSDADLKVKGMKNSPKRYSTKKAMSIRRAVHVGITIILSVS